MDRHAVPRQITTFEFKLIGYFTVKQFIYLLIFAGLTVIVFFVIPVPFLNIIMAACTALFGLALVFYKHNERPLDVWLKNLVTSLLNPSQFYFIKDNPIPDFLRGVYAVSGSVAETHIDASQKLSNYMQQTGQKEQVNQEKQNINKLIHAVPAAPGTQAQTQSGEVIQNAVALNLQTQQVSDTDVQTPDQPVQQSVSSQPFMSGVVYNSKSEPLPNIMIYINSEAGQVMRILKTNHNGIFATFHPLPTGTFIISPKDLGGNYFFDTMNVTIDGPQREPLQIFSKELL